MERSEISGIKTQLVDRKQRLLRAIKHRDAGVKYVSLLKEVDAALERIDTGTYGICMVCHDPIEDERLIVNPLLTVCLDHLDEHQRHSLETDLDMANKIQRSMLPKKNPEKIGWDVYYHYEPAGAVSGDYVDVIEYNNDNFFILGDVSGKGIAASMLMSHIHAIFHSMIPSGLEVAKLVEHASNLLCESTLASHYATLLCVKANEKGNIEICNAGHPASLLINKNGVREIGSTGMPIGLFCDSGYATTNLKLESGDVLLLFSDGLTESFFNDEEYGIERVKKAASDNYHLSSKELVEFLLVDVNKYIAGKPKKDDLTIMAVRKT